MWTLRVLGGAALARDDGVQVPMQRRPLAVLIAIALAGDRGINREKLATLFWPESTEEHAKGATRQMLHVLRRSLGASEIIQGSAVLTFDHTLLTSDLEALQDSSRRCDAESIARIYCGPFLDGFTVAGADGFNRWADRERERIAALVRGSYEKRAKQLGASGEHAAAVAVWMRAQSLDPTDAPIVLSLMRALDSAGEAGAALRHARLYQSLIGTELESEADPAIGVLASQIKARGLSELVRDSDSNIPSKNSYSHATSVATGKATGIVDHRSAQLSANRESWPKRRLIALTLFACVGLASAIAGIRAVHQSAPGATIDRVAGQPSVRRPPLRVVVLPLSFGMDSTHRYVADGVAAAIRDQLSGDPAVQVLGAATSDSYRDSQKSVDSVANELQATYVVTGGISFPNKEDRSSVILRPELRRVGQQRVEWTHEYRISVANLASVSDSIATAVAIDLGLLGGRLVIPPSTGNAESRTRAYDEFMKAEEAAGYQGTWQVSRAQRAIPLYRESLRNDSLFVPAWVGLAHAEAVLFYDNATIEQASAAQHAAARAKALAPKWPGSFLAEGIVARLVEKNLTHARDAFREGLVYAPHDVDLLTLAADAERSFGRWDSAFTMYELAESLDPRSPRVSLRLVEWFLFQHQYDRAIEEADRGLSFDPTNLDIRLRKVMAQLGDGKLAAAHETIRATPQSVDRVTLAQHFGMYYDLVWVLDDSLKSILLSESSEVFRADSSLEWALLGELAMYRGDTLQARAFYRHVVEPDRRQLSQFPDDEHLLITYCMDLAYIGRAHDAIAVCKRGIELDRESPDAFHEWANVIYLAVVATFAGDHELAIASLDSALHHPSPMSRGMLRIDPRFAPLHADPKFWRLLASH